MLATQNPIEQEGTYPLPEAQLDRFMFLIEVGYPTAAEEKEIARATTGVDAARAQPPARRREGHRLPGNRPPRAVPEHIYDYAVKLVRKTRPGEPEAPQWIKDMSAGAPVRAPCNISSSARKPAPPSAALHGLARRLEPSPPPCSAHRVITNFAAESQGMTSKKIVERLIKEMRED